MRISQNCKDVFIDLKSQQNVTFLPIVELRFVLSEWFLQTCGDNVAALKRCQITWKGLKRKRQAPRKK